MPDFDPPTGAALMVGTSTTHALEIRTLFKTAWKALSPPPRKDTLMTASPPMGMGSSSVGEGGLEDGADLFGIRVRVGRGVVHISQIRSEG
jgi:hypothetical protein